MKEKPQESDDLDLVLQAQQNNPEAFGELYEKYVKKIYNYVYYRTHDNSDAEDITSKVFHRALESINRYEHRSNVSFLAWLYRIAHNLCANYWRDHSRKSKKEAFSIDEIKRDQSSPIELPTPKNQNPEEQVISLLENRRIRQAINCLIPQYQEIIILKFTSSLTNLEIAKIQGISEGATKSRLHRAIASLRKKLEQIP